MLQSTTKKTFSLDELLSNAHLINDKKIDNKILEGDFNDLFNHWKDHTVPSIENYFRPPNMVYEIKCHNCNNEQILNSTG